MLGWHRLRASWHRHRDRVADVTLTAVFLVGTLPVLLNADSSWVVAQAALTVAVVAALWWRRRYPVAVAVGAIVAAALGATELLVPVALFTLATRRRDRVLVATAAVAATSLVVPGPTTIFPTGLADTLLVAAVSSGVYVGLPVAAGAFLGARRDLLTSLRDRAARAEAEHQLRAEQARRSERARIAHEMHDVLAHRISLVALHAGGLEVNPSHPADVERTAALIRTTARQALEDLRGVLGVLRADGADGDDAVPQPTLADIRDLVASSRQAGAPVRLDADLEGGLPPELLGRTAYRIVQEGLTNALRHAHGAAVRVRLADEDGALAVEVRNGLSSGSAPGHRLPEGAGLGLVGLRERVDLAGGELVAGPDADGGFTVRASLPWPR